MKFIKRLIRGARYSEKYGHHPGTEMLVAILVCGAIAGLRHGIWGALAGFFLAAVFAVPLWLIGCWERGE